MRILIAEPQDYSAEALAIYRSLGTVVAEKTLTREELLGAVADADVLVLRLAHKIDREILDAASALKVIACPATGLDHIDQAHAAERGITVIGLKGEVDFLRTIYASSEHVMAMLFGLIRRIPQAHDSVMKGEWQRDRFKGYELHGKTMGIIGFGRIGSIVAQMAQGCGMHVVVTDPAAQPHAVGVEHVSLDELLAQADVVVLAVPYAPETEKMMDAVTFSKMKDGAIFVNISRGQLVDESALLATLQSGKLGGVALDVLWAEEKRPVVITGDPLVEYAKTHQNLLITPHIGGATFDSMAKTEVFIAKKVKALLDQNPVK